MHPIQELNSQEVKYIFIFTHMQVSPVPQWSTHPIGQQMLLVLFQPETQTPFGVVSGRASVIKLPNHTCRAVTTPHDKGATESSSSTFKYANVLQIFLSFSLKDGLLEEKQSKISEHTTSCFFPSCLTLVLRLQCYKCYISTLCESTLQSPCLVIVVSMCCGHFSLQYAHYTPEHKSDLITPRRSYRQLRNPAWNVFTKSSPVQQSVSQLEV